MSEIYLLDSNCFITPARNYYGYDFAPSFWGQLKDVLLRPEVLVVREVRDEIQKDTEIGPWLKKIAGFEPFSTKTTEIVAAYAEIMQYIETCRFYSRAGISVWAQRSIADPWLIAVARTLESAWIVTQEQSVGKLSVTSPTKKVKIPDVACYFHVPCMDLFTFMRRMKFRL